MTSTGGRDDSDAPVVAVIIPCYNQARFLRDAIDSVRRQTFRNYELLVVDDGSTDETAAVVASARGVRYLRQARQGPGAARNSGLRASQSRFVTFLDADDRLLPNALEVGVGSMDAHSECGFVSGHYRIISTGGAHARFGPRECVNGDHYVELLKRNYIGTTATVLFRREAVEDLGGYDCSLRGCEDYDLYLRVARSWPAYCHDKLIAEYRRHDANTSHDLRLMLRTSIRVLRKQRPQLRQERERAAYREGLREYRRRYGDPLLQKVLEGWRQHHRWRSVVFDLLCLLRCRPAGTTRWVFRTARHWMARPRSCRPI